MKQTKLLSAALTTIATLDTHADILEPKNGNQLNALFDLRLAASLPLIK